MGSGQKFPGITRIVDIDNVDKIGNKIDTTDNTDSSALDPKLDSELELELDLNSNSSFILQQSPFRLPSTPHQRFYIDYTIRWVGMRMHYPKFMEYVSKIVGRKVTDLREISSSEAREIIQICRRDEYGRMDEYGRKYGRGKKAGSVRAGRI